MKDWLEKWTQEKHKNYKIKNFNILDYYLDCTPITILDIGCGLAYESEMFQKKYNCDLYLLDGDFDLTADRNRDRKFGNVEDFKFYNPIKTLQESFNYRNMKYNFVDANNISIDNNIKFDLVYSILSCGFHYPADTYYDLLKKHTTNTTRILLDIRKTELQRLDKFEIIKEIKVYKKYSTVEIKLK